MTRCCAAIVLLSFFCATVMGGEQKAETRAIAVVKTWNDLAKQPGVELHKSATARFGIQTLRAPQFSGVMLYCMTEAYDPDAEADGSDGDRLGPFRLNVRGPGPGDEKIEPESEKKAHDHGKRDYGRLVFGQVIALAKLGTYSIELLDANDTVVASAIIESVDAPFHPWTTLVAPDEEMPQDTELESENVSQGIVQTAAGRAGVPLLDGSAPILYWAASGARGPQKFNESDPLPTIPDEGPGEPPPLATAQVDQAAKWIAALSSERYDARRAASDALFALGAPIGDALHAAARQTRDAETLLRLRDVLERLDGPFHIQMDGLSVRLKLPEFTPTAAVERYFLARWWVNGKPVKANEEMEAPELSEQSGATPSRSARFKLQCKPAALGAKKGDKIALQVLFCPGGMRGVLESGEALKPKAAEESDGESEAFPDLLPMISNRVEFTLP